MSDTAGKDPKPVAGNVGVSVFGDSHCGRFAISRQMIACMPLLKAVDLALHPFSGGTITGFGKRSSSLGIADKIRTAIRPHDRLLVFNFGQVDVELGYFYRLAVKREEVDFAAFVERLVATYMDFLRPLRGAAPIAVKGINPSVLTYFRDRAIRYTSRIIAENLPDARSRAEAEQVLREVFPDPRTIAANHRAFNHAVQAACAAEGYFYYDIADVLTDPVTDMVRPDLVLEAFDHHVASTLGVHLAYWRPLAGPIEAARRITG
ncbi:hypothetical protein [Oharaeibacter diazotrophicus]|uniref:Uncharacterized protein n=1 Tax=Oharaeibacter diazotrophicus TaxID=1920512 RepID=A0A4R6RC81_9HYPH|nr:hypothetical protein [Oharaeibacter diazotrophicus]TDP83276.1 hypothetical protein EDD54_3235 [Oharaeibacter diazotrophicus]BBE72109.1 hypothetical protein OHA_1_01696 [Pleomorphomonas sp. SM30]GLS78874.1 hypothetical protein GCM10007904_42110 [Oharaeibacter diazotrophicus]